MRDENAPSLTAFFSAAARAAHPLVDDAPHLIEDTVALALCRVQTPSPLDYQLYRPSEPILAAARLSACMRSHVAEQVMRASDFSQYLVLGAGLDTSAHNFVTSTALTWLVDLPGVLDWRSGLFEQAGKKDVGTYVPGDLSAGIPFAELRSSGLDFNQPVLVSWLGVSMYLDTSSNEAMLTELAKLPSGSEIIFDYMAPPEWRDEQGKIYALELTKVAGGAGEPWRTTPDPGTVETWLTEAGWTVISDVAEADAAPSGFWPRNDALTPMRVARIVRARLDSRS
ncbi:MAG: SAM-dependent methyltransferase [Nocardiopsaceae bacterium]|nr:SAM-dependent methyltransferase [Nocardiopsaceae bacterium]